MKANQKGPSYKSYCLLLVQSLIPETTVSVCVCFAGGCVHQLTAPAALTLTNLAVYQMHLREL